MQSLEALQQRINEAAEDLAAATHGAVRQRFAVPGEVPQEVVDRYGKDFADRLNAGELTPPYSE